MAMDQSLVYGVVTASTTMAGGLWVASRPRAWLTQARLAQMMALGGGLLLAALFREMLPESLAHGGSHALSWIFAGVMAVLLFERYVAPRLSFLDRTPVPGGCHDHESGHDDAHTDGASKAVLSHGAACSALGCLLVCTFFDGVAMAASFGVSAEVGVMVAVGLVFHMLPEGVLASALVLASGHSAVWARRAAVAVSVCFVLGLLVPGMMGVALGDMAMALPFAAGILLYVVLGQLLPVALQERNGVPLVVAGVVIFEVLSRLLPHSHG